MFSPVYLSFQAVHAQEQPTLADTINLVASNINETASSWNAVYGQIFGLENQSVFDNAILEALAQSDYNDVIFIARLAELNNYSSQVINDTVITALQNTPMAGSLPITYSDYGKYNVPDSFLVYDRYMVNAYRYAQEFNVSGWNINQAFLDFATQYLKPPSNSQNGEMLWINPQQSFSKSYSSRYYDEHAETLDMFLELALAGTNTSVPYNGTLYNVTDFMDDAWANTQSHWNGNIYGYTGANAGVECEMGNFAQIIAEYRNYRGDIPYFQNVIADLENKLLINEFASDGWGTTGVIQHADGNPQQRLYETMGALIALQMLYPYFSPDMQANFRDMITNGTAWQGLLSSNLYNNGQFRLFDTSQYAGETEYGDDASLLGLMILFLYGVIPDTGYLAITPINERYEDYRTSFPVSEWAFDYQNRMIRIPVIQGNLSFIFGSQEVSENFTSSGVYDVNFAPDWNSILSIAKIADFNSSATLQPVTLQTIPRIPTPTPTTTPTSSPVFKPASTMTPTSSPTLTPSPSPTPTATPDVTPTQSPSINTSPTPFRVTMPFIVFAVVGLVVAAAGVVYIKKFKHS